MKIFITIIMLFCSIGVFAGKAVSPRNIPPVKTETLIIFYRSDCPYCQNMTKVLEKETVFSDLLEANFNLQRVNIETEEGRSLAARFNVHAVPSFIRFNAASGENSMIRGFPGIQKLAALLQLDYSPAIPTVVGAGTESITTLSSVGNATASTGKILLGCGDGIVQAGEQCDDGNVVNGDGCSSTCTVQVGYNCVGSPSTCTTTCGDGIVAGSETCDDGNTTNGDGCSSTCTVQLGYTCTGIPSSCTTTCGDGIKAGSEQCDDGNVANGDGCSSTCTVQAGYICVGNPSVCTAVCGDGIVAGSETCDDGNVVNGDGCGSSCNIEPGYVCTGSPSSCVNNNINDNCSNAITLTGQSGSVSGNNSTATNSSPAIPTGCATTGEKDLWYKFTIASSTTVQFALNGITMLDPLLSIYSGSCGTLASVACDDDGGPGNNSLITTTLAAGTYYVRVLSFGTTNSGSYNLVYNISGVICGDGIVGAGEECDDGNTTSGDGCSSTCLFENAAAVKGVSINRDGVRADPSSMLDVKSTESGVLIPRMSSTQRTAIASPAKGLLVFDITTNTFWYYKTSWVEIGATANTGFNAFNGNTQSIPINGSVTSAFPTEQYDDGNHFATPYFTPTETALYKFDAFVTFTLVNTGTPYVLTVKIQSTSTGIDLAANSQVIPAGFGGTIRINVSANTKISAGSLIGVVITNGNVSPQTVSSVTFSGYKVY